jgi:PD-(D/E)XK nuclease family transposase
MRRTPVFGDPKTGFVFQRVFGSEDHKTALIGFLNDILQLDDAHRITSVMLLPPEQRPKVSELKYPIVDVKCVDARGTPLQTSPSSPIAHITGVHETSIRRDDQGIVAGSSSSLPNSTPT